VIKVHGSVVLYGVGEDPARLRRTAEALREADGVIAVTPIYTDVGTRQCCHRA